jgi:hypothetical protein
MKLNLFVEYFEHPNKEREQELKDTLLKNICSGLFDNVFIFSQKQYDFLPNVILIENRVNFLDYIQYFTDDINIVANLDIEFDESICYVKELDMNNIAICLTRWNRKGYCGTQTGEPLKEDTLQWNPKDSHDCWIVQGKIPYNIMFSVNFGIPGCDGRLAYIFQSLGYKTINIPHKIKTYHNHMTGGYLGHRTYTEEMRTYAPCSQVDIT